MLTKVQAHKLESLSDDELKRMIKDAESLITSHGQQTASAVRGCKYRYIRFCIRRLDV